MQSSFPLEDTLYTAEQAQLWQCTRTTGVYSSEKDLIVKAVGGMRVSVSEGIAWLGLERFKGIVYGNTDVMYFDLDYADGELQRIDRIVVRHDYVDNKTLLKVKKGTFNSNPTPPALERTPGVGYEIALADIFVARGAVQIIQSNITDKRLDETVCGVMTDGVKSIPTQMLVAQWESWFQNFKNTVNGDTMELTEWIYLFKQQSTKAFNDFIALKDADFEAWFQTIKGRLGTDLAGNLQLQILDLEHDFTSNMLKIPGRKETVDFSVAGRIFTTIEDKATGVKIATQEVTFPSNGIQKVITLFKPDGVQIARRDTYLTTFSASKITTS